MGSENFYLNHHQLQQQGEQQLVYSSLPSSSSPASSARVLTLEDSWNPSSIIFGTGDEFNRYMNEILPNSKEYFWPKNMDFSPCVKRSILEADHDHHTDKPYSFEFRGSNVNQSLIMPEKLLQFDQHTDPKGAAVAASSASANCSIFKYNSFKNGQEDEEDEDGIIDLNQNLWINSFPDQYPNLFIASSSTSAINNLPLVQQPTDNVIIKCRSYEEDNDQGRRGCATTYQPFPESTISSAGGAYSNSFHHDNNSPSNSSNKTSNSVRKDVWRKNKRPKSKNASDDHDHQVGKKPRANVPQSSSCPTLKVRKEKLGDRIAALHRMVSPFGKTDTASVLTEAIGYIQFLQDQIQRLSMTYLKSPGSSSCPTTRGGRLGMKGRKEEEGGERQDLKSRGLCLVPLAFTSYVFSYNGSIC